ALIIDDGVHHGPGTTVESVREFDCLNVDGFARNGFATKNAIAAATLEIATRHHHVPGSNRISISDRQERPEEWQEDSGCEKGVLDDPQITQIVLPNPCNLWRDLTQEVCKF